ncbi:MAG: GDP-fucose synthetase, partial [Micavibrio sp.]|nr:GDP-fucose synthetase [Micavibrio sp.]
QSENYKIIYAPHNELELTDQSQTYEWLKINKPDVIIMAAGRVGGIGANASNQAAFLQDNLSMTQNVIHGAHLADVEKLIYLGSSCIYPKEALQPISENALLTGALEPTNEGYALAKIAGVKLCEFCSTQYGRNYRSVMPTNLYGEHDHFDAEKSHVIPALMLKIHQAKINGDEEVALWGTGKPLREFLYVDDLAGALIHVLNDNGTDLIINIGSGEEISIKELSALMASIIGYKGSIVFDPLKPDGTMRKLLNSKKINDMGWKAKTNLQDGLKKTYRWFLENVD